LSHALRLELAPFHIDVITIQPGGIQSDFSKAANRVVSQILKPDSLYTPIEDAVRERAQMSQKNATPAMEFANGVIENLGRAKPKPVQRLGNMGFLLPFLARWMPTRLSNRILMKRFGLTKLEEGG
jgi:short-subunit dehydrogenase